MRIKWHEITARRIVEALQRRVADLPDKYPWRHSAFAKNNAQALLTYKDKHKGERCFLIANGPSLKQMDLSVLANEYTISMNRAYLLYDDWGFQPTYFTCINELVLEQFTEDIAGLDMPKFINFNRRSRFKRFPTKHLHFLRFRLSLNDRFEDDVLKMMSSGGTVTFAGLQLAYFMGFEEVIIIGMDHNFVEKGRPNKTELRTSEKDESHCHPDYFPKGIKWQLPDLYRSELAYALARQAYETNGRKVLDATVGGKCDVFEKADFSSLVAAG